MRSQEEMFSLILGVAQADERIRAVVMNGSRANPNARRDCFQDYDIGYIVRDVAPFYNNLDFIEVFGERLMLQMPETMRWPSGDGSFVYLMLFADHNRIDLSVKTLPMLKAEVLGADRGQPIVALLDKDGILDWLEPPSDRVYHVRPPTAHEFDSCCNNFWWCLQNAAKELKRGGLAFVMDMLNTYVRAELHCVMDWFIGREYAFAVSVGKHGKDYGRLLSARHYGMYRATYADADEAHIWDAMFAMGALFRELARAVAADFGFDYPLRDDQNMTSYLRAVRALPQPSEAERQ